MENRETDILAALELSIALGRAFARESEIVLVGFLAPGNNGAQDQEGNSDPR
jgi:hypothetical protein